MVGTNQTLHPAGPADRVTVLNPVPCTLQAQVIGMLAYLQTRGVWGPLLLVSHASGLATWAAELHKMLPATLVHVHDGSASSRDVLNHVVGQQSECRRGGRRPLCSCGRDSENAVVYCRWVV